MRTRCFSRRCPLTMSQTLSTGESQVSGIIRGLDNIVPVSVPPAGCILRLRGLLALTVNIQTCVQPGALHNYVRSKVQSYSDNPINSAIIVLIAEA